MNKKRKTALLLVIVVLLMSSCAKRRFDYLNERRIEKQESYKKGKEEEKSVYPDDIIKLSFDEYKVWYKDLNNPPHLNLPHPQEPKKLSNEQMVEDFEYYFTQMSENYPFFGVLKREHGIDFLKSHDLYLEKIKSSKSDKEFLETMKEINSELKNHHANIADRPYVEKTQEYFSNYWENPSMYYEFLSLNTQKVRNRYDLKGFQSHEDSTIKKDRQRNAEQDNETIDSIENRENNDSNMTIEDLGDGIAKIKIKEMVSGEKLDEDRNTFERFLKNKDKYHKLVIDIRDNAGGSMDYWQNFLLPELLTEDKSVSNHMFFKNGKKTKEILELEKESVQFIKNVNLDELELSHKEDLKKFSYYKEDNIEVKAKGDGFSGQIFLLTNERVFSAAEGLASFVKNTGLATIVGTNTGGDGITIGIINDVLPNSGLVFTYTNTLGISPDGKINEEEKTQPDIKTHSYKESIDIIKNNY